MRVHSSILGFRAGDRVELSGVKGTTLYSATDGELWIKWDGGSINGFGADNPLIAQIRKLPPEGPVYITGQWYKAARSDVLYKLTDDGWYAFYRDLYRDNFGSKPELLPQDEPYRHHLPLVEVELS